MRCIIIIMCDVLCCCNYICKWKNMKNFKLMDFLITWVALIEVDPSHCDNLAKGQDCSNGGRVKGSFLEK